MESSSSLIDSRRKWFIQNSEQQQATSAVHPGEVGSSSIVHLDERPSRGVSQPQRVRGHTSVPEALSNPLYPPNSAAHTILTFTAQPGIRKETDNFAPIQFYLLFPD